MPRRRTPAQKSAPSPLGSNKSKGIKAMEAILESKDSPIDIKQIAYQFMRQVEGPAGFVKRIMEEYDGSEIGSLARSRILDIMVRLFQIATPKDKFGDLADMTDEDLVEILKEQFGDQKAKPHGWVDHTCI